MKKFHDHMYRDATEFGTVVEDDDGVLEINVTTEQKIATVMHAAQDVISYLDQILRVHNRNVVDYAIWYIEKHPEEETYSQLIMLLTCHCIVQSEFLAPDEQWQLVEFTDIQLSL